MTIRVPPRSASGHKGTFGTVCVLGGQAAPPRVMIGAPALAASAALRSGAGLAVVAAPAPVLPAAMIIAPGATGLALPVDDARALCAAEVATLLDRHRVSWDCLAVGPGWGAGAPQQQILVRLLAAGDIPMVIDADGLNALAGVRDFAQEIQGPAVLTPHPGEYRRLAAALDLDPEPGDEDEARCAAARDLAARLGCVVVLKGRGTVVSDGIRTEINATGNVALATAGTGDVLTGVIAGLVAQWLSRGELDLFECARLGVHVHGLVADRWAGQHGDRGLLATDLIEGLPDAFAELS
jgi:NAD(P)H-hydrate epimerase